MDTPNQTTPYSVRDVGSVSQFPTEAEARVFAEYAEELIRSTTRVFVVQRDDNSGVWVVLQTLRYVEAPGAQSYHLPLPVQEGG